jgi:hypothetical protein
MRNKTNTTVLVATLTLLALADAASAYYSPRLGRFLSRDPIDEPGAVLLRQTAAPSTPLFATRSQQFHKTFIPRGPLGNPSFSSRWQYALAGNSGVLPGMLNALTGGDTDAERLYRFVRNSPATDIDPLGLNRWIDGTLHHTITVQCGGSCKTIQFGADYWRWYGGELIGVITVGGPGRVTVTSDPCPSSVPTIGSSKDEDDCLCKKFKDGDTRYYDLWWYNCNHFVAQYQDYGIGGCPDDPCKKTQGFPTPRFNIPGTDLPIGGGLL